MSYSFNTTENQSLPGKVSFLGWFIVALIVTALYAPLLLNGGIITDDWGDIFASINCNTFWQCYADWFPLFSNRPLAPLPITLTTRLFGTHYSLYLLTNSFIYLSALFITARAFTPFISPFSRQVFILLAAVPCIAMPVIVSPINQLTATVAFLYWAASLYLLVKYCQSGNRYGYFFTYLLLLCGFLTYEIILPLLFFTAFLPALLITPKDLISWLKYFTKFIVPILIILILVIFWQKVLAPYFMEVYSRLNFNPAHFSRNLFTWIHLFIAQLPNLFITAIPYISYESLGLFSLLASLFWILRKNIAQHLNQQAKTLNLLFLIISTGALISSSLIFILTDESAVSWGYQARGLSSTWFALAIWIASIVNFSQVLPQILKVICLFTTLCFICLSTLSFVIQRDKYIESWKLQMHILKDIDQLIQANKIGSNASIIFDVPQYTPNNYNRELVYSQSWDLPVALMIATGSHIQSGVVIDSRIKNLQGLQIQNEHALVNDGGRVSLKNLWLYDFDPSTKKGSFIFLNNQAALEEQMIRWKSR
jgi:hypothetical protein